MNRFVKRAGACCVSAALVLAAGQAMAQPYPQQGDYPPPQGYPQQGGYPPQPGYPGDGRPNGMPANMGNRPQRVVHCESNGWSRNFCAIPLQPYDHVRVLRRYSEKPCGLGRTWFTGPEGIYVDDGCRADFLVVARRPQPRVAYLGPSQGGAYGPGPNGGYGPNQPPQGQQPYQGDPRGMPPQGADGPGDGNMPPPGYQQGGGGPYGAPTGQYAPAPRRGSVTVQDPDQPPQPNAYDPRQGGCGNGQANPSNCAPPGEDPTSPR